MADEPRLTSSKLITESDTGMEIEQASDDDVPLDEYNEDSMPRRRRKGQRRMLEESEYAEDDDGIENADESDEAPLDDLEPENIVDPVEEAKAKNKAKNEKKVASRRHRTDVEEANLIGDEQEETVFIDNLPNDEHGIRAMLGEVRRNII